MNGSRKINAAELTEGSPLRALGTLAGPMLVGAILQNIQSLIDLFWVGSLGGVAVAAVAMAGTMLMVLFPLLMGLATGTIALVARAIGEGRPEMANRVVSQ
ncbi:MAG: MATE family efflux transporter, partial [Planctomycetota bacterium]